MSRTKAVLAAGLVLAALAAVHGQTASTSRAAANYGAGPVAVAPREGSEAVVLQADGRVHTMNLANGSIGTWTYRIPAGYQAVDVAAGAVRGRSVTCFSLNSRLSKQSGSFVLQVAADKKELWTWMRVPGVYVGLAIEPARGVVYVANSSTNEIFSVALGNPKATPVRIATVQGAVKIGALALAAATRRLYVSDMSGPRIYTIELNGGAVRAVDAGVEEARAIAWDAATKRLFIADSGREAILVIDPNAKVPRAERLISDKRLRDPAGLAVSPDGTLWVADESARTIFQISAAGQSILRAVRWAIPKS